VTAAYVVPLALLAVALAATVTAACWWHGRQRPARLADRVHGPAWRAHEARTLAAHVDDWADLDRPDNRALWAAAADLVWQTDEPGREVLGR
jgi:hypothetical protein